MHLEGKREPKRGGEHVFRPEHCANMTGYIRSVHYRRGASHVRTLVRTRHKRVGRVMGDPEDGPTIRELSDGPFPPPALDIPAIMVTPPLTSPYY